MVTIGIDLGTQSIKVLAYDFDKNKIVAESSQSLDLITGENGLREQKADDWINALEVCFSELPQDILQEVKSISVSGQQHGFVPVAKDGHALYNVKLWCDTSTAKECDELTSRFGGVERLIKEVGNPILPGYTASKILWLKKNHKELFNKISYVMLPHDYINYYLTGIAVMEMGDASGTALMDIRKGAWNKELCALIDETLIDKLPNVISSPKIIGNILPDIAARLGLPTGVKIASGGGDNMMGAIGTGTVSDGILSLSLGTSGTLYTSSSKPIVDSRGNLAAFCSSHGTWLPLLCTMNCTVASELTRNLMGIDVKEFDTLAENAPLGSDGLFAFPFFNGERIPNLPNGRGTIVGFTPYNMSKENIARSMLEGVTYEFLLGLDSFRKLGVECKTISLTGGGSNSAIWRQIVADMTGCTVRVPIVKQAAAFGAAIHAYWLSSGKKLNEIIDEYVLFDSSKKTYPNLDNYSKYQELYTKWCQYVSALTPLFK